MVRPLALAGILAAALGLAPAAGSQVDPVAPDAIAGLVAWYRIDDLTAGVTKDREPIFRWPDASGKGHDLSGAQTGPNAVLVARQLGDKPIVEVRQGLTLAVQNPFELGDHTIVLVYRSKLTQRALLRSDLEPTRGIALVEGSTLHLYRLGEVGHRTVPYTTPIGLSKEFGITILGRDDWKARAFIDGADVSSWTESRQILRVGAFFDLVYSKQVSYDGRGLEIAEMAFYDRFLDANERAGLTRHLASKYGLAVRDTSDVPLRERLRELAATAGRRLAWLDTTWQGNLNAREGVAVAWTGGQRTDPPFARDPAQPTRVTCTADATAAQIHLALGLRSPRPGTEVRVLLLKNNAEYLDEQAVSGPFGGDAAAGSTTVELETTTLLAAGDFLEVLVFATGAEGEVTLDPERSVLVVAAP
jgi:hypothetical protein